MPSESALLRAELARMHAECNTLEAFCISMYDVTSDAIKTLTSKVECADMRAEMLQVENSNLKKQLNIETGWNGRPSENKAYVESRASFNRDSARYEAKKDGKDPDEVAPVRPCGGQLGHKGVSRKGKPDKKRVFKASMCLHCGRTDLIDAKVVYKRVFGGHDLENGKEECEMYVICHGQCLDCNAITIPHTDVIKGSAFKPDVRGTIRTYHAGGTSVGTSKSYMKDLAKTSISTGAISNCTTAMANEADQDVFYVPHGTPILIDDGDLRISRSPVEPYAIDWNAKDISPYARNDSLLTRCSTVWTSSLVQPPITTIIEVASMEPYAGADETTHKVKKKNVQVLVVRTRRTTQLKVVDHKYVDKVQQFLEWMTNRVFTRDGAQLYRWHKADKQRCCVHLNRASEDYAMTKGIGSEEYVRHTMLRGIYHDAKNIAAKITEMAGGPITSACDLDIIKRKNLTEYVDEQMAIFTDKIDMVINMIDDGLATTLKNARDQMFTAFKYPGLSIHNNDTEQEILRNVITGGRKKGPFPNWQAARNFSIQKTFAATCKKNGISVYNATIRMSKDPNWSIFTDRVPPPIISYKQRQSLDNIRP